MNKKSLVCFFIFFNHLYGVVGSGGNVFGLTRFSDTPEFLAGGPVRIDLLPYLPRECLEEEKKMGFIVIADYQVSTNNNKIGEFLFPHGDVLLTTTGGPDYFESTAVNKQVRDIDAAILGITDPQFISITKILPSSTVAYLGCMGYYHFLLNENNTPRLSFQVAFPYIHMNHTIIGNESIYQTGPEYQNSPIKSVLAGLSRSTLDAQRWCFAREGLTKSQIANVECTLSYNYLPMEQCSVETYLGILIPIKKKCDRDDVFIFSPQIINSAYIGCQYGTTISLFLYNNDERSVKFIIGNNLLYFLPNNNAIRSFDLYQKPWSRYLMAYENFQLANQTNQPIVNYLTFISRVSPNFSNISTAQIDFIQDIYAFSIGYSLFARQSESVTILDDLPNVVLQGSNLNNPGIIPPLSLVRTASLRLEMEDLFCTEPVYQAPSYYYAKIDNTMIDISSGTHPAVFLGELYGKISLNYEEKAKIVFAGSYRFCHNNTAIEYATIWGGIELFF